jgi:hypothetical protein
LCDINAPASLALAGEHLRRYPAMQAIDVYKLLYQACRGPGHAVTDATAARRWLEREAQSAARDPAQLLIEDLAPLGPFVRVYLAPYLSSGRSLEALANAFVTSTAVTLANTTSLAETCRQLAAAVATGALAGAPADLPAQFAALGAEGFPAVHHSERYRTLYRPAYRVIAHAELAGLDIEP